MKVDFSKCPGCKEDWENKCTRCDHRQDIPACFTCKLKYQPDRGMVFKEFTATSPSVHWNSDKRCWIDTFELESTDSVALILSHQFPEYFSERIPMPWLKYDVTLEQVQLYLTFS